MKLTLRIISITVFAFSLLLTANAQYEPMLEAGVDRHKGIDQIYRDFSEGYATLDAAKVAGLYASDASYLSPSGRTVKGRTAILNNFERFFSNVKERGETMKISFQIETRRISKDLGYDIGVFKIVFSREGAVTNTSRGRFVVVTVKDPDGKWRFDVDAYASLDNDDK